MQYKNTVEAAYINLDEIQQIIANMGIDGTIHSIDIDLAMDKLRHVYDLLISLKGEASLTEARHAEFLPKEKGTTTGREKQAIEPDEKTVEEKTGKPVKPQEPDFQEGKLKPEPEKTKAQIESRVRPVEGQKFLGDTLNIEKHTLNEELSQKVPGADLSSHLKTKPISNIASAIGLNEKFELIQNLFNGDKLKYEKTLDILNAATNFNEAYDYLASNFNWDMNSVYAQRLLELIRRKLIVRKNEQ